MKKKSIAKVIPFLVMILVLSFIVWPQSLDSSMEMLGSNPVSSTEFKSELKQVGKSSYAVYAFVNETGSDNKPEYAITVLKRGGLLNNQYSIEGYKGIETDSITNPNYKNIFMYPEHVVKVHSKYYGSIYYGISPTTCKKITINGNEAEMERIKINEQGINADFYLYYLIVEEEEHEKPTLICEDADGSKYQIISEDLAEFSTVKKL